jgi:hypothetical protein
MAQDGTAPRAARTSAAAAEGSAPSSQMTDSKSRGRPQLSESAAPSAGR